MLPTSGKKRTRSDETVLPKDVDPASRRKGAPGVRQARFVYPYCPTSQSTTFLVKPVPLPPPHVTPQSVTFCLPPGRNDLNFVFQVATCPGQNVYMRSIMPIPPLTFQINQRQFVNVVLPCNVSRAIVNGNNLVSFCQHASPCSAIVELKLDIAEDIEQMVQFVLEGLPKAEPITMDPFAGTDTLPRMEKIEIPCRGRLCKHPQCFDLRAFLRYAIDTGIWQCPFCGVGLQLVDLRHDPTYLEREERQQAAFEEILDAFGPEDETFGVPRDF